MYKAIGFDLGGVIIDYSVPHQIDFLAQVLGVDRPVLAEVYYRHRPVLDTGEITNEEFWRRLITESGSKVDTAETEHLWSDGYTKTPLIGGMLDLVNRLKGHDYKVGVLSNLDAEHTMLNRERHIFEPFDAVLFSNELHEIKPHPAAYQRLADELEVQVQELIFIDDLAENIAGAKQAGCYGILFDSYQDLIKQLQQIGINCD